MLRRRVASLLGSLGLLSGIAGIAVTQTACSGADAETSQDGTQAASDRTYAFTYANPDQPYTTIDANVLQKALAKIERVSRGADTTLRRDLAKLTLERIEAGDVLLGSVGSARGIDRFHMCKDLKMSACEGVEAPSADDRTWLGDEALGRKLENGLDGYQWGNRIYFTIKRNTNPDALAKTLVHEVNHVLNRSECSYYANLAAHEMDGNKAFVEEYRAYVSECYFVKDTSANVDTCTAYATPILDQIYGFEHDLRVIVPRGKRAENKSVTELVVATAEGSEPVLGRLLPEKAHWPRSFGACPRR